MIRSQVFEASAEEKFYLYHAACRFGFISHLPHLLGLCSSGGGFFFSAAPNYPLDKRRSLKKLVCDALQAASALPLQTIEIRYPWWQYHKEVKPTIEVISKCLNGLDIADTTLLQVREFRSESSTSSTGIRILATFRLPKPKGVMDAKLALYKRLIRSILQDCIHDKLETSSVRVACVDLEFM